VVLLPLLVAELKFNVHFVELIRKKANAIIPSYAVDAFLKLNMPIKDRKRKPFSADFLQQKEAVADYGEGLSRIIDL
jgi:hypothetical protein